MQREIREFEDEKPVVCKFSNFIFGSRCVIGVYVKIG